MDVRGFYEEPELNSRAQSRAPSPFPFTRYANVALRCAHLVGIAGQAGGVLFQLPEQSWQPYTHLALLSGVLLAALYLVTDRAWLKKLKGQAVLVKLALLAGAYRFASWRPFLFLSVIVWSAFFAHAPDRVRSYAWGRNVPGCREPSGP